MRVKTKSSTAEQGKALVRVEKLKKYFNTFRGSLHAVDDISFDIKKGKTLGMVGESGCGKSTTGRLLVRLHESTSGSIVYDGTEVTSASERDMNVLRTRMQMIFQDPYSSINPRHTVASIIGEPLKIHKKVGSSLEYEERVRQLMSTVGLAERLYDAYPHELDGGRRQRIGIARALILQPEFVVCDEPVSALDVSVRAQVLNLMAGLQKELGLTYLFISHDLSVVKHISDRVAVMYLGRIVEITGKRELYAKPLHPYTQALLEAVPTIKGGLKSVPIPAFGHTETFGPG